MKIQWIAMLALAVTFVCEGAESESSAPGPTISFTTINRSLTSTSDLDKSDDTRAFTSEALFAQSQGRLNRPLTQSELRNIVRIKHESESFNYLRLRPDDNWAMDFIYRYRKIGDAQITQFFSPNQFNDVKVNEYGLALQRSFKIDPLSGFLRASYKQQDREGLIEFLPNSKDAVNQYELNGLLSKKLGRETTSDEVAVYGTYVRQDIKLKIPNPYERNRDIYGLMLTLGQSTGEKISDGQRRISSSEQLFERRFDTRGVKLFGSLLSDVETFGTVDVTKRDIVFSTSICAWWNAGMCSVGSHRVDLGLEVGNLSSKVSGDPSQDNAQRRTGMTLYYQPNASMVLVVPLRRDIATSGPNSFENWKAGLELRFEETQQNIGSARFNVFGTIRYDHQRYTVLDKNVNLLGATIGLRF